MFTAFYMMCFVYYTLKAIGDQYIINFVNQTQDGAVRKLRFVVGNTVIVYTFINRHKEGAIIRVSKEPINQNHTPNE
jgi:hypothetical protein